jgi:hypothetical protein
VFARVLLGGQKRRLAIVGRRDRAAQVVELVDDLLPAGLLQIVQDPMG